MSEPAAIRALRRSLRGAREPDIRGRLRRLWIFFKGSTVVAAPSQRRSEATCGGDGSLRPDTRSSGEDANDRGSMSVAPTLELRG